MPRAKVVLNLGPGTVGDKSRSPKFRLLHRDLVKVGVENRSNQRQHQPLRRQKLEAKSLMIELRLSKTPRNPPKNCQAERIVLRLTWQSLAHGKHR